ncbi:MAG: class I SAM-dependent methyltransferase [Acidobacteria bacterium]|nr:class I SAM-dependent methyltransferase [Acidobacteriota bacterium]
MPSTIDAQAKLFDDCADVYARYRPRYPDAALETLVSKLRLNPGALLCDLGAGPGMLSFLLAEREFRLVAVEPLQEMRRHGAETAIARGLPVAFVGGQAEAIPVCDISVEAVLCGQAFHWFEAGTALREIHRVLKPGGGLALLWNNQDWQHIQWLAEVERLIMKYNPQHDPNYRAKDWAGILNASQWFRPAEHFEYTYDRYPEAEEVLGLIESYSYVRIIPPEAQHQLMQEVTALLEREQPLNRRLLLRYRTELYLARKE